MKKHNMRMYNGEYREARKIFRLIRSKRPKLHNNNWRKIHGYPKLSRVYLSPLGELLVIRKDYEDLIEKGIYRV